MIIQWGVLRRVHDSQSQNLVDRAADFIKWLSKQKCNVIVPSIVVGEVLLPVDPVAHTDALSEFSTKWIVVDYDIRAARRFAEISRSRAVKDIKKEIQKANPDVTRSHLKADMMILATALIHGADHLYTHDGDFLKIANLYIAAENFLDVSVQMSLPERTEE